MEGLKTMERLSVENVSFSFGFKEILKDINFTLEKGSVSINLNDCKTAGNYNVPIQVTLPDGIELEDTINVKITLTKSSGGENDQ